MSPDSPRRAAAPTPAAGGEHIRPEWVDAAARAIADVVIERDWSDLGSVADAALAAVVPAIQAQALRDAVEDVYEEERGIIRWLRDRADRIERGELP